MATEVSELLATLRLRDETAAGMAAANDRLRQVADQATRAERSVEGLGAGVKVADREFSNAGRSIGTVTRSIDGNAAAAAAANRVLRQHADAVEKLRLQHEREGTSAAKAAEELRRLDVVRDTGLAKARAAGARIEAQFIAQGTATGQASDQLARYGSVADLVQRSSEGMASRLGGAGTALGALGVAGTVAAAGIAVVGTALIGIARAGDQAVATLGRLQAVTGSASAAADVYERLYQSSQKTGVAVAEAAGTFARFQIAAGEIGATRDQVLRLVEGLQKVAIVSGASAQEGGAAMQQLGQALASGKLNGDELRSVMENMPQLAQRLARELGTNIGQLRKMGEEGQLTADKVFPALLRATEKMSADFDRLPLTMSRAFDILGNSMLNFVEKLDKALGISQLIARAAKAAADAVNSVRAAVMPSDREAALKGIADAQAIIASETSKRGPDYAAVIAKYQRPGMTEEEARRRAMTVEGPRGLSEADPKRLADARAALHKHQIDLAEIEREGQAERFGQYVTAQAKAAEAARTRATAEFKEIEEKGQKLLKLEREHLEEVQKIDLAERTGAASPERISAARLAAAENYYDERKKIIDAATADERKAAKEAESAAEKAAKAAKAEVDKRQGVIDKLDEQVSAAQRATAATAAGAEGSKAMALALEVENKLREAGIPGIEKRTAAEQSAAEVIEARVRQLDSLKTAQKKVDEEFEKSRAFQERSWNELGNIADRAFERVGDAIVNAFINGQGAAVNFGNIARGILASVVSDVAKLAVINPILNSLFTSSAGARPTLAGAFGGGGTGGFGGLGSLLGSGWETLSSGGYLAGGGGFSGALFGTPAVEAIFPGGFSSAGTSGLFGSGGSFSMGSLGSTLGGIGAGFGLGNLVGGLVANSQAQSQNAMIGSALGSLIGSFGGPFGSLIGGLLGGAGGGLIGPKDSVKGWSYAIRSTGPSDGWEHGDALKMDDIFYNESGKAQFDAANASIAAINEFLAANKLTVWGARAVGGNKNGPDDSWGGAASFGDALADLRFGAKDNARLNTYLTGKSFDDPAKLAEAVQGFNAAAAAIDALGAEAVPAFTASLKAVNDNFDKGVEQAKKYGLAEDNLTTARARALAALEAERTETLRRSDVSLSIRRLVAAGSTLDAELARQAEAARQEVDAFKLSLDALALTAADKGARLVELEQTQAAERARIIADFGEQAAAALRQAGGSIRAYLDSLASGTAGGASPTDRLAAANAAFVRDRTLATGGDRDALGRITGSADALLSAGRDMFASGPAFQALKNGIVTSLSNLPVVQSYDAMQTASLAAIQQAIQTGTLNTATTILPGGNTVQVAGGTIAMTGVETRLDGLRDTLLAIAGVTHATLHAINAGGVARHETLIQATGLLGWIFDQQFQQLQTAVAHHTTAVNTEAALYALGLIGNAANENLALGNRVAADASAANVVALNFGNKLAADIRTDTFAAAARLSVIDNTLKALANYGIAGFQAQNAGNTIAADTAGAIVAGFAAQNRIAVDASAAAVAGFGAVNTNIVNVGNAEVAALNASNTIAASNANAFVAALNAGNTITADGNIRLGNITAYASFIDNTGKALANYAIEQIRLQREILAALAKLDGTVRTLAAAEIAAERDALQDVVDAVDGLRRPLERAVVAAA